MATKKKPNRKPAKAPVKVEVGRPTKYQPAYVQQARRLALLGMTDKEMADFFGVAESTLHLWKKEHPEFSESVKAGKEGADVDVATSLYRAAIGGGIVTELKEETDAEGNAIKKKTVKELPANVTAQIFWLKNRQPKQWREKVVVEDETPSIHVKAEELSAAMERSRKHMLARDRDMYLSRARLLLDDPDPVRLGRVGLTVDDLKHAAGMSIEELKTEFGYSRDERF